jgi:hypothetical protein
MGFGLDLKAFGEKVDARTNAVVRNITAGVLLSLVARSPVGDASYWINPPPPGYVGGRFRGNWQAGIDEPNLVTTEDVDPSGEKTISRNTEAINLSGAGHKIFITNSLPYAQRLENGWSRQAPLGIVGLTVIEFEPIVKAAVAALKAESNV